MKCCRRVVLAVASASIVSIYVAGGVNADSADGEVALLAEVMEWAKANGAFISDKIEVKQIVGSLSGIFAKEPIKSGEIVSSIPWKLIIQPPRGRGRGFCAGMMGALEALKADPSTQSPYVRYLASRSVDYHPVFWSTNGRNLLQEMKGEYLVSGHVDDAVQHTLDLFGCDDIEVDESVRHAMMLAMTRTEGTSFDHLVPFNDLINHRNGKDYTADPVYHIGENYQIVARRDIATGEQIRNSYNQCSWCTAYRNPPTIDGLDGYWLTPHLFDFYGFVEETPQRWIVPKYRLLFDVVESDAKDGTLEAHFAVPPSPLGVSFLESEVKRLESFEELYKNGRNESTSNIPLVELNGIWEYHGAILAAYKLAVEQAKREVVSDEVWYKGRSSWYWEGDESNEEEDYDDDDDDDDDDEEEEEGSRVSDAAVEEIEKDEL